MIKKLLGMIVTSLIVCAFIIMFQPSGWDVRAAGGALVSLYNTNFKISDTSTILP